MNKKDTIMAVLNTNNEIFIMHIVIWEQKKNTCACKKTNLNQNKS